MLPFFDPVQASTDFFGLDLPLQSVQRHLHPSSQSRKEQMVLLWKEYILYWIFVTLFLHPVIPVPSSIGRTSWKSHLVSFLLCSNLIRHVLSLKSLETTRPLYQILSDCFAKTGCFTWLSSAKFGLLYSFKSTYRTRSPCENLKIHIFDDLWFYSKHIQVYYVFISSPTLIQLETTISIQVKWAWHHISMDRIRKQYNDREIFQRID